MASVYKFVGRLPGGATYRWNASKTVCEVSNAKWNRMSKPMQDWYIYDILDQKFGYRGER